MFRLSIIIPIGARATSIAVCMNSIKSQTFKDVEVLCVCPADLDCNSLFSDSNDVDDERFKVFYVEGTDYSALINAGIEFSSGEYLGFVEPGDCIFPTALEFLYSMAKDHNLDVVKCDFLTSAGQEKAKYDYNAVHRSNAYYNRVFCPIEEMPYYAKNLTQSRIWGGLYKTSFLRECGIRCVSSSEQPFREVGFRYQVYAHARRVMLVDEPLYVRASTTPLERGESISLEFAAARRYLESHADARDGLHACYCYQRYIETVRGMGPLPYESKYAVCIALGDEMRELERSAKLNLALFDDRQASDVRLLIDDPVRFFTRKGYTDSSSSRIKTLKKRLNESEDCCNKLLNSEEYRLGSRLLRQRRMNDEAKKRLAHKRELFASESRKLIVSLTWTASYDDYLEDAIDSLLDQTLPADEIDLWLPKSRFPRGRIQLGRSMVKRGGKVLKACVCDDSELRYAHLNTLEQHPGDIVVLVRCGVIYDQSTLEDLYRLHQDFQFSICGKAGLVIRETHSGGIAPYSTWDSAKEERSPHKEYFALPEGGVLYPPDSLDDLAFRRDLAKRAAPFDIDIWLSAAARLNGTSVVLCQPGYEPERLFMDIKTRRDSIDACVASVRNELLLQPFIF